MKVGSLVSPLTSNESLFSYSAAAGGGGRGKSVRGVFEDSSSSVTALTFFSSSSTHSSPSFGSNSSMANFSPSSSSSDVTNSPFFNNLIFNRVEFADKHLKLFGRIIRHTSSSSSSSSVSLLLPQVVRHSSSSSSSLDRNQNSSLTSETKYLSSTFSSDDQNAAAAASLQQKPRSILCHSSSSSSTAWEFSTLPPSLPPSSSSSTTFYSFVEFADLKSTYEICREYILTDILNEQTSGQLIYQYPQQLRRNIYSMTISHKNQQLHTEKQERRQQQHRQQQGQSSSSVSSSAFQGKTTSLFSSSSLSLPPPYPSSFGKMLELKNLSFRLPASVLCIPLDGYDFLIEGEETRRLTSWFGETFYSLADGILEALKLREKKEKCRKKRRTRLMMTMTADKASAVSSFSSSSSPPSSLSQRKRKDEEYVFDVNCLKNINFVSSTQAAEDIISPSPSFPSSSPSSSSSSPSSPSSSSSSSSSSRSSDVGGEKMSRNTEVHFRVVKPHLWLTTASWKRETLNDMLAIGQASLQKRLDCLCNHKSTVAAAVGSKTTSFSSVIRRTNDLCKCSGSSRDKNSSINSNTEGGRVRRKKDEDDDDYDEEYEKISNGKGRKNRLADVESFPFPRSYYNRVLKNNPLYVHGIVMASTLDAYVSVTEEDDKKGREDRRTNEDEKVATFLWKTNKTFGGPQFNFSKKWLTIENAVEEIEQWMNQTSLASPESWHPMIIGRHYSKLQKCKDVKCWVRRSDCHVVIEIMIW